MSGKIQADLILTNAAQMLTCHPDAPDRVGMIQEGWLAAKDGLIVAVGSKEEVLSKVHRDGALILDATHKVVAPGFVDCHTHLVFAGSRQEEFTRRLEGETTESLKASQFVLGMQASVLATRQSTDEDLYQSSHERLQNMLQSGTTTVESKSGYGLTLRDEVRCLRVNQRLNLESPVDVCSTFLGAHGWPPEMSKNSYMELLIHEMLPFIARENLATACDVWCDDGYYTAEESKTILLAARRHGLDLKIHTDAYSDIGGAQLAAELHMLSADHLNYAPSSALAQLAAACVPGVLLPGTDFNTNHPKPFDPKPMLQQGMTLALATNCNPGNWIDAMPIAIALACKRHKLTPAEALRAATFGGATALGLQSDRGSLEPGKLADLQIWKTCHYEDMAFRLGSPLVEMVIKKGRVVYERKILGGF